MRERHKVLAMNDLHKIVVTRQTARELYEAADRAVREFNHECAMTDTPREQVWSQTVTAFCEAYGKSGRNLNLEALIEMAHDARNGEADDKHVSQWRRYCLFRHDMNAGRVKDGNWSIPAIGDHFLKLNRWALDFTGTTRWVDIERAITADQLRGGRLIP